MEAVVLGNLGAVHQELGELEAASELRRRAVRLLTDVGDRRLRGVFLGALAAGALEQGELGTALGHLEEALELTGDAGDRRHAGLFRAYLGVIEAQRPGHLDAARAAFHVAHSTLEAVGDPALLRALSVHEAHLDVARGATDPEAVARVRERLDAARRIEAQSDEVRLAVRLLERALGRSEREERPVVRLRVAPEGASFVLGNGESVDLGKRKTMRLILLRLVSQRLSASGAALSVDDILDAGWPGERVLADAAANRVYVTIATLGKLGLRDALASRDGGYLIDEDVVVEYS